jgi:DNA-binding CsgD family transcriptional regulator
MKANAPSAQRLAENAFLVVLDTEEIDAFICAYRAYPPLAASVCKRREWRGKLAHILGLGRDRDLARRLKLPQARRTQRALDLLTPREQEVLELVASGLANKAIAKTLFITEATVKVHVRHICEKLGVRTRTEAAVRAASYRPSGDFCDGVGL